MTGFFRSILAMMALMLVFSCAETLEEHAVKEAAEFTQKNCPAPLSRDLTIDSMTFDTRTKTFRYYYSLSPNFEYRNLDMDLCRKELLSQLKNRTTLRIYKEAGYSFRYIYYPLQDPKNIVLDLCFTKADYNTSSQP